MKELTCESELECMGGESAHHTNWYCPLEDNNHKPKVGENIPKGYNVLSCDRYCLHTGRCSGNCY